VSIGDDPRAAGLSSMGRSAGCGTLLRECPPDWLRQSSSFISLRKAPQPADLNDG
jgi:hypothetical protein